MVNSKSLIPPCSRVSIAFVNDAFEEFPADVINPINRQPKRRKGFGKILCTIAYDNNGDATVLGCPVQISPQCGKIKRPVIFIISYAVVGRGKYGQINRIVWKIG